MKSFVKQTEIRTELEDSYHELQTCSMQFNVGRLSLSVPFHLHCSQIALHLYASNRGQELEEIRRHDHNELIEMITKVLHDKNLLKVALANGPPEDAQSVVQAIEQARSWISSHYPQISHITYRNSGRRTLERRRRESSKRTSRSCAGGWRSYHQWSTVRDCLPIPEFCAYRGLPYSQWHSLSDK